MPDVDFRKAILIIVRYRVGDGISIGDSRHPAEGLVTDNTGEVRSAVQQGLS